MNLRILRKKSGLTMKQLGEKIGVAESTISLYEKGTREPDNATLFKLADYFGVSVDYLLGRTDTPTPETSDLEMPAELESVRMAFYGGPSNLSQKSLQDIAEYVKFIQERDKKEKK